jgi:hypothetical protein
VSAIDGGRAASAGGWRVDQRRAARERTIDAIAARGREQGLDVAFLVWSGPPATVIAEAADAEGADLIVIGARAGGASPAVAAEGIAAYLARHARCPVVEVRPVETSEERFVTPLHGREAEPTGKSRRQSAYGRGDGRHRAFPPIDPTPRDPGGGRAPARGGL